MPVISVYVNTFIAMLLLMLLFVLLSGKNRGLASHVPLFLLGIILYYSLFLYESVMSSGLVIGIWGAFLSLLPIVVGYTLVDQKMIKEVAKVMYVVIIIYTITSITTYIGLGLFPNASRMMAFGTIEDNAIYYRYNIGGYGFIYSLVILHPMIVAFLRKKTNLLICIAFSFIAGMVIVKADYTIAILLFLLSCFSYLMPLDNEKNVKLKTRMLIVFALIVFLNIGSLLDFLAVQTFLGESSLKIADVSRILQGSQFTELDMTIREELYRDSWETFIESHCLGSVFINTATKVGGHSMIIDFLGNWGILGGISIILVYMFYIKLFKRIAGANRIVWFSYLSLFISILVSLLNTGFGTYELGLLVPIALLYPTYDNMQSNHGG